MISGWDLGNGCGWGGRVSWGWTWKKRESLRTNNVVHIKWVGEFLGVGLGEGLRTNNVVHIKYRPCISHCAIL